MGRRMNDEEKRQAVEEIVSGIRKHLMSSEDWNVNTKRSLYVGPGRDGYNHHCYGPTLKIVIDAKVPINKKQFATFRKKLGGTYEEVME